MPSRVVVSGGGTAGHVTPGIALAMALAARGREVSFVGTDRGLEARMVPAAGFEVHLVASRPFIRRVSLAALRGPFAALAAVGRCRPVVRGADAVVGVGGYASIPAVIAARRERVPIVLHEQNAVPGLANRLLSRMAAAVALSFPDAAGRFPRRVRTVLTGNPVRQAILRVPAERARLAEEARVAFDLEEGRRTVVVFGGSQGALHVAQATIGACRLLRHRADLQVLLITGGAHLDPVRCAWADLDGAVPLLVRVVDFVERMELVYASADLVVARGGASSVAEIAACGVPALLIPYPHSAAGEQEANARALQRAGGASLMLDAQVEPESLAARIESLIDGGERLAAMAERSSAFGRPDAAERLADLVEEVARA